MTPQEKNTLIEGLIEKHQVHGALNGGMGQRLYSAMSELIDLLEPKWVSLEERLPEEEYTVNILLEYKKRIWVLSGFIAPDGNWYTDALNGIGIPKAVNRIPYNILKWTPLPTPPKQ